MKRWEAHRFDDICPLEEAVLSPVPEGQVALAVGDEEVVVQRVEGRPGHLLLQCLQITSEVKKVSCKCIFTNIQDFPSNDSRTLLKFILDETV